MQEEKNDLHDLFQKEQEYLTQKRKAEPELFVRGEEYTQDELLKRIGIILPTGNRSEGYIKFSPFDFIVEEIMQDGSVVSATEEEESVTNMPLDEKELTIYADLVKLCALTPDAVNEIARLLSVDIKNIGYAGIKDVYALTAQRISIRRAGIEAVKAINAKNFYLKNIIAGKGALQPGDLYGNRFTILVRTIDKSTQEEWSKRFANLKQSGCWNFYWTQRFGARSLTHVWGMYLMQGDYEGAVRSYLCGHGTTITPYYLQFREKAAKHFGNWQVMKEVFEELPFTARYELTLINHLIENPTDFVGAINTIPDQVKLWIYAYGSYLFNRVLSQYIATGTEPPKEIPLFLSDKRQDQMFYKEYAMIDNIPGNFYQNLRPFPYVRLMSRTNTTMFYPTLHQVKKIPQGIILSFDLEKGAYATTFLSHYFNLREGMPLPEWLPTEDVDTKKELGYGSSEKAKERLGSCYIPKLDYDE